MIVGLRLMIDIQSTNGSEAHKDTARNGKHPRIFGSIADQDHAHEKQGWLASEWGLSENNRRAKYYQLTAQGRQQLRSKTAVWTEYAGAVFKVLQTT